MAGPYTISYNILDDYLVVRINRRTAIRTKLRGLGSRIEHVLEDLGEDERPIAAIVIALTLYRCRDAEKYVGMVTRSLFEPNMKRLLYAIADYYANMHTILQNLASRLSNLTRYVLNTLS